MKVSICPFKSISDRSVFAHGLVDVSFTFEGLVLGATWNRVLLLALNYLIWNRLLWILIEDKFSVCFGFARENMQAILCFVTGGAWSVCTCPFPLSQFLLFFSFSSQLCESLFAMSDVLSNDVLLVYDEQDDSILTMCGILYFWGDGLPS